MEKSAVRRIQVPETEKKENVTAENLAYNFLNMMCKIPSHRPKNPSRIQRKPHLGVSSKAEKQRQRECLKRIS